MHMESDEVCYYNGTTEVVLCREEELVFFFIPEPSHLKQ